MVKNTTKLINNLAFNSTKGNSLESTENNKQEYNTLEYKNKNKNKNKIDLTSSNNTNLNNDTDDIDDILNLLIIKQRFQSSLKKFLLTTSINDIEILREYIQMLHCKYKTKKYELDLIIISKILFNIDYLKENNYDVENNYNIVNDFIKKINIKDLENKNLIIDITNFFINSICLVV